MASYRIYFVGHLHHILAREDFDAEGDCVAMFIGRRLFDACSDVCASFELWQGARRVDIIASAQPAHAAASELNIKTQDATVALEERLKASHWTIRESARLLQETARLVAQNRSQPSRPS